MPATFPSTTMKIALVLLLLAASTFAQNTTSTFVFSGGLPFCSQCGGDGQYACSNGIGSFKEDLVMMDEINPALGDVANNVQVQLYGAWSCDSSIGMVEVDFNEVPLNVVITKPTDSCACGSCDPVLTFQGYFPAGFPDYNYGGHNVVHLEMATSYVCINKVVVTIGHGKPLYPGLSSKVVRWTNAAYTGSYRVCNNRGYTSTSVSDTFADPLPENSLLVMAEVDVFGSYFCQSTSQSTTLKAQLQSTTVDSETLANNGKGCSGTYLCDGAVRLSNSILYQAGWPKYAYGASNSLSISSSPYTSYVGKSALYLYYFQFSSKEERDLHIENMRERQ